MELIAYLRKKVADPGIHEDLQDQIFNYDNICYFRSIDYISFWDATTPEEVLNWMLYLGEFQRKVFVRMACREQPKKNFWEALQRVCGVWSTIREKYSYKELYIDPIKCQEIMLKHCDWLRVDVEPGSSSMKQEKL